MSKPVKGERAGKWPAAVGQGTARTATGNSAVPSAVTDGPADLSPVQAGRANDGRSNRWRAHRERRRQEFVQAALRVLGSVGPDLPMDAVAAEAGVTKPVLYRYFADKAALVDAIGEASSELLLDRLLPAIRSASPPLQRIRDAVGAYFAVIDEFPNVYWLFARRSWSDASIDPVQRDKEFIASTLTAILGDYLRTFGLDSGAAEPWAYGITGLVQSTGEWWLVRRSMSREHVVEYVTRLLWAAMSGVLRDAGIVINPDELLPPARPLMPLRPADSDSQDAPAARVSRRADGRS